MKLCRRAAVLLVLWFSASLAWAQLDVIELRNRSAEEVLPLVQPMLAPGASLSGTGSQLFLKTSPANRADIHKMIAALDKPLQRLIIRIAQDRQATQAGQGGGQAWGTRQMRSDNAAQMVQTVDGSSAFIQVGRSLPVALRQAVIGPGGTVLSETTLYRDLASGFYATPHVTGQRVSIEISQQSETAQGALGRAGSQRQSLATTVSGRLGEWIELGGSGRQAGGPGAGYAVGTQELREQRSIWLQVEAVD